MAINVPRVVDVREHCELHIKEPFKYPTRVMMHDLYIHVFITQVSHEILHYSGRLR